MNNTFQTSQRDLTSRCSAVADLLPLLEHPGLEAEEAAAVRAHLASCSACQARQAAYRGLERDTRHYLSPSGTPRRHRTEELLAAIGQEVPMDTLDTAPPSAFPPKPPTWRQQVGRRTVTLMSAIAAVLMIVLVITALIASHNSGTPSRIGNGPTATAATPSTSTPTRPINQQWQVLPHLANITGLVGTWLAPSDPRVVYQTVSDGQGGLAALRRSDDQGATWQNLPVPFGAQERLGELSISPTNAKHVLALAQRACSSSQTSVVGPLSPLSDGQSCIVIYFSNNGGESWTPVTLPAHGSHNLFLGYGIFAQENRLYAILFVEPGLTASELVESLDDGATWHFADRGLMPEQHCLEGIAGPATSTTLYVTTRNNCDNSANGTDTAQLWRSDDAGVQWRPVSTIGAIFANMLWAVNVSGQSQPVLIHIPLPNGMMQFSLDDGKSWQSVPALGNPGTIPFSLGILHDGSLLEQGDDGFYAWKAGDASWHKVTPAPAGPVFSSHVVFDKASGKDTLYLEVRPSGANSYSFYSIDLP